MKSMIVFLINFLLIYKTNASSNILINNYILKNNLGNDFINYLLNKNINLLNETDNNKCKEDLNAISAALQNKEDWAISLLDSWGKIPSGIKMGNIVEMGSFDECLNVTSTNSSDPIKGQYCLASTPLDDLMPKQVQIDFEPEFRAGGPMSTDNTPKLSIGICIPHTCSSRFLEQTINTFLKERLSSNLTIIIPSTTCTIKEGIIYDTVDIVAITFFSIIGAIMVLSSIYDYLSQKYERTPLPILIAFSVLTNGKKLFAVPRKNTSTEVVTCLHGIRCMSIIWVMFGHTYVIYGYLPLINKAAVLDWMQSPYAMLLISGTVSVDTFFFLSGFLVAWTAFKEMEKSKGKLNIPLMYFHRYIRLTPVLMVVILFYVSLLRHTGTGPFWNSVHNITIQACEKNWWSTILYVQNYATIKEVCLGPTWYLAVDTQLYLFSPLLLIPAYKWGSKFLLPTTLILTLLSMGCVFANYMKYDFSISSVAPGANAAIRMEKTYFPTHTRYSPWLVGFVLGYYMLKNRFNRSNLSPAVAISGWLAAFTVIMAIIYGIYPKQQTGAITTTLESAFYESCSRVSWAIAIAWIVFACQNGYGGFINSFLSYPFWQVLGRLTYSIYIIHMLVELIRSGMTRAPQHFSNYGVMNTFWGDFGFTILISVVVVLAFESPIIGIEKAIFTKKKKIVNISTQLSSHNVENAKNDYHKNLEMTKKNTEVY